MKRILAAILALNCSAAIAQTITVKDTVCTTYGFSDPNPIPQLSKIYPYETFQQFDLKPSERTWKMVVLENDWIRVKIFPEIGGKIWSIYDKTRSQEMFYDNSVIKFREISLRGPWTSGGIEFNYGIIGHAPSCAHPVDWKTMEKEDGSISCYIGVIELLTRTRWSIEINLPKDAVYVRTSSFWHNGSGEFQPYYTWANSGVRASEDLEIVYPGTYTIGHDGVTTPYPIDEQGHDLSRYAEQNFGIDKSFHPGGTHKGFFGAYWAADDFGMLHYALRDEKLGRKYFSWAQSPQGDIWKSLLTDENPQYVELQSGRLFNQNLLESISTPYKQFLFTPFGTDTWNEYWLPFSQLGGRPDDMTLSAVVRVTEDNGKTSVGIYALRPLKGKLSLLDKDGKEIESGLLDLNPSEAQNNEYAIAGLSRITLDGKKLWSSDTQDTDRPHVIAEDFDLNSAQGQMIHARYLLGMREYALAEQKIDNSLSLDPTLVEALNIKAMLSYRKMDYKTAYDNTNKVLAINEYDAEANYIGGLAALALGKKYDAMDRFEIAALTSELRSAAYTQLAKIHFIEGDLELSAQYARKSLSSNTSNTTACQILYEIKPEERLLGHIERKNPLDHFADIERMLDGKMSAEALAASIQEEQRVQDYLEYAVFYYNLGLKEKAVKLLEACPDDNILVALWTAYLKDDPGAIKDAEKSSIDFVFPFRAESAAVLRWAVANGGSWKSSYLLSMLRGFQGDKSEALSLISGNESDYAPYYACRYRLGGDIKDAEKAQSLDPEEWRYLNDIALYNYSKGDYKKAIETLSSYYGKHKENFHIGDTYVKSLIADGQYAKADKVLCEMTILPFEGQSGSHVMYRDIKLHLAASAIDSGKYKEALKHIAAAREWPENLGVGKPYDNLIDSSTEDWLESIVNERLTSGKSYKSYPKVTPLLDNPSAASDKKLF